MRGETCTGPDCDKPQMVRFDLCNAHRVQQTKGKPLKRLKVWRYGPDDTCVFETCDKRPVLNGLCRTHDYQRKEGKKLRQIRERRETVAGYSETKQCNTCLETKNWRLFVMGVDYNRKPECRDCYRKRILPPKDESKGKKFDLESLFAGIDTGTK